jgi:hypothetical protein
LQSRGHLGGERGRGRGVGRREGERAAVVVIEVAAVEVEQ